MADDRTAPADRVLVLDARPVPLGRWLAEVRAHREVFAMLARKDFQTRYKRASLGVLWAVAVPMLQAAVMAVVFSKVVRLGSTDGYGAYVFGGVLAFSYFGGSLSAGVTSIVDGASLTDKVWFPRVLLPLVPPTAGLVSLVVSITALLVVTVPLGGDLGVGTLLLLPATVLLLAFTTAACLVASASHVYFRDTRFLVQAGLLLWIYVTPVLYPRDLLGRISPWLDLNPLTGVAVLFHRATGFEGEAVARPVLSSVVATLALLALGVRLQRRHDRLFVDLL